MRHFILYNFSKLLLLFFFLSSCATEKIVHGNLPEANLVSLLKVGEDSKETTTKILGEPHLKVFLVIIPFIM